MSTLTALESAVQFGVVPVLAIENVDDALPLADALIAGGLPVAEITFRTDAAAEAIRRIAESRPEIHVGAGTLLTPEQVDAAVASGAQFAVAPGLNPRIVERARELNLPFSPGVCTPSDVEGALELGCRFLKFFPAEAAGGVTMLRALAGPYGHTGVRFMPTGGINLGNLPAYGALPVVAAVGGTWIATKEHLAAGDWAGIAARCREAVAAAREAMGG